MQAEKYALKHFNDGSTAVVVYIDDNNKLHCAWTGDSRAVLESNGKLAFATQDHKPDSPKELQRISKAGGTIYKHGVWRINGLAISRSIGDKPCKINAKGQIIAIPEYAAIQLTPENHFLIIASDGLWDVMSNEQVIDIIKKELKNNISIAPSINIMEDVAIKIQNIAIKKGSSDNITVCLIKFSWNEINSIESHSIIKKLWNWIWSK
ncbi:MAG TPA: PP2C family protein-serine/threonine phosphatase [Candidatus Babeliales bacterium]|nr:PP2C family protein-serine/threonine phosphatase [Candidatus Babeliales bacterium]